MLGRVNLTITTTGSCGVLFRASSRMGLFFLNLPGFDRFATAGAASGRDCRRVQRQRAAPVTLQGNPRERQRQCRGLDIHPQRPRKYTKDRHHIHLGTFTILYFISVIQNNSFANIAHVFIWTHLMTDIFSPNMNNCNDAVYGYANIYLQHNNRQKSDIVHSLNNSGLDLSLRFYRSAHFNQSINLFFIYFLLPITVFSCSIRIDYFFSSFLMVIVNQIFSLALTLVLTCAK